jgi:hypothetical protein
MKIISAIASAVIVGFSDIIMITGPEGEELFEIPCGAIIFEKLTEVVTGILFLIQAKLALMASASKTRTGSWDFVKKSLWIITAHILIYIV